VTAPAGRQEEEEAMADNIGNVVGFPKVSKRQRKQIVELLILKGYLQHSQRNNWCAVEKAINNAFYAAVFDPRPELSPQKVLEQMLKTPR
jgi:hypothetical protein